MIKNLAKKMSSPKIVNIIISIGKPTILLKTQADWPRSSHKRFAETRAAV